MSCSWVAVWTRSRHEKSVRDDLASRSLEVFLPLLEMPSRRKDRRKTVDLPVFPGYLFVNLTSPDSPHVVTSTRGVVRILGPSATEYSIVPEGQVNAVRTMVESRLRIDPFPYLKTGAIVRVKVGPLMGLEGVLIEKRTHCRLVVSVDLLGQAISTEISAEQVEAV